VDAVVARVDVPQLNASTPPSARVASRPVSRVAIAPLPPTMLRFQP
jgi:hypothetical protein